MADYDVFSIPVEPVTPELGAGRVARGFSVDSIPRAPVSTGRSKFSLRISHAPKIANTLSGEIN